MKKLVLPLFIVITLMSCGSEENTDKAVAGPAKVADTPIPSDLDKKFTEIMDKYEKKISHDFFSDFTSTTRRGGEGTTETTFDATAFDNFMKRKGFTPVPNVSMGYTGTEDGVEINFSEKTVSGEKGGWIHQWTIKVQGSAEGRTFNKQRNFSIVPGA
jgi:hypothetical protein